MPEDEGEGGDGHLESNTEMAVPPLPAPTENENETGFKAKRGRTPGATKKKLPPPWTTTESLSLINVSHPTLLCCGHCSFSLSTYVTDVSAGLHRQPEGNPQAGGSNPPHHLLGQRYQLEWALVLGLPATHELVEWREP